MRAYLEYLRITLKLTLRDRTVLFFNYAFPLAFFFIFAQMMHAERGGAIVQALTMVLAIGVLGNGFFGAGIRAVQDRELNILRRFKVAPISAAPIQMASAVTGLLNFLPSAVLMILLSHVLYGMDFPSRPLSLLVFISIGVLAFRALGLIIAAVVNSMQESQILVQLLYIPMLMLSGATIPLAILPAWIQTLAQYLPATYLISGMQAILTANESIRQNWTAAGALLITSGLAILLSVKLFRWEKEEKLPARSKLWVLAALTPFVLLGIKETYSHESVRKAKLMARNLQRRRSLLIRNARIFVGDSRVIESGAVLIQNGKITRVYEGSSPEASQLRADAIDGSGKTLLPGLIDVHVHLGSNGGLSTLPDDWNPDTAMPRDLAAYLYSGVTAVKSDGDALSAVLRIRKLVNSGERLGAEFFICGPMFTAEGGHGTEYAQYIPEQYRQAFLSDMTRIPKSAYEARRQVDDLKKAGVDGIKAILEAGVNGSTFRRLDPALLVAIAGEARAQNLPIVVHTGDARDVADALAARVNGIEHGSMRERLPVDLFQKMKALGVAYDPTLSEAESYTDFESGSFEPLERPLVQQAAPPRLILSTKLLLHSQSKSSGFVNLEYAKQNLLEAWKSGVMLVTGTDSGNPLLLHGPALHRELLLWVEAGIPPQIALEAATYNGARLLRAEDRIGLVQPGREANLLLVDGNPLEDIRMTERIRTVIFKGEQIDRAQLFTQN